MMALIALCAFSISLFSAIYGQANIHPFRLINRCPAELEKRWSYRGQNGPPFWFLIGYPDCYEDDGQSPIAINSRDAEKDENLAKLDLNGYDQTITQARIENNGYTIEITPEDDVSRTISVNGDESFTLRQFHFHWGDASNRGSEHTLDGTRYAMEMHLVHMNEQDEVAVVGIFFQEQDNNNEELQKIVDELPNLKYEGDESSVSINLDNLLLHNNPTSYYRYEGSLTTPGCAEGVTWSVVPDPIPVGTAQISWKSDDGKAFSRTANEMLGHHMKQFRNLYSVEKEDALKTCKLVNNYRPLQPLGDREVYLSQ